MSDSKRTPKNSLPKKSVRAPTHFTFSDQRIAHALSSPLPSSPISISSPIVNPSTVEHERTIREIEKRELEKQHRTAFAIALYHGKKMPEMKTEKEPEQLRAEKLFAECKAKHGKLLKELVNPELDDNYGYLRIIKSMTDMLDQKESQNMLMTATIQHALSVKEFRDATRENPRIFAILMGQLIKPNPALFHLFNAVTLPPLMRLLLENNQPAKIKRENLETIIITLCRANMDVDLTTPPLNLFCQIVACDGIESPAIRILENEILAKLDELLISNKQFSTFMKQWDDLRHETKGDIVGPALFPRMFELAKRDYPSGIDERRFYYLFDLLNRSLEFARREKNILLLIGKSERPAAFTKIIEELKQLSDSLSKPSFEELDRLEAALQSVVPKLEYVAAHKGLHGLRASPCKSDWNEFCRENAVSLKMLNATPTLKHEMKQP